MSNSKRKTVLNYLRDTVFKGISVAGGYNFDVVDVERGIREVDSLPNSSFPAIFISKTVEHRKNITVNQFHGMIDIIVFGIVKKRTSSLVGLQEDLDDLIEDITKALEADRTFGNRVKWMEITGIETDDGDRDPFAVCAVTVSLVYCSEGVTP